VLSLVYGLNCDKEGHLTDVGASAMERAINKEINLMDAGRRRLHNDSIFGNNIQGEV